MRQMFISKFLRDWNISQPVLKRRDKVHGVLFCFVLFLCFRHPKKDIIKHKCRVFWNCWVGCYFDMLLLYPMLQCYWFQWIIRFHRERHVWLATPLGFEIFLESEVKYLHFSRLILFGVLWNNSKKKKIHILSFHHIFFSKNEPNSWNLR